MRVLRWWRGRSLRGRITMVAAAAALGGFLVLAQVMATVLTKGLTDQMDNQLQGVLLAASSSVADGKPTPTQEGAVLVRVLNTAGEPLDGNSPVDLYPSEVRSLLAGGPMTVYRNYNSTRWKPNVVSAPDGSPRLVLAGLDAGDHLRLFENIAVWFVPVALLGTAAVAFTAWVTVRWSLRPVERMRSAAQALPAGERLPLPEARDELHSLAEALNSLLARRDESAERMRQFSGAAAHELRSPVASIRAQAEVAVAYPDPDEAQEVLEEVAIEAERLSEVVDHLLKLARSDTAALPPVDAVELTGLVRDVVRRQPDDGPLVRVETFVPVWVRATGQEVELVLDNLLRNARRYARTQVRVMVLPAGPQARLVVDDDGEGIPPEHRERVFDRFYRVHGARDRDSGGAGLGLAMVADVVHRREGSVRAGASPEGGARLEIRWHTHKF
ncbi:ATP-binding protein [Allokutzneria sp. A3M-2-11 16]|uniref:sensor histidine kinase n=1 Tax=Allokutzneria sp. A3M-2-11 16 TaxID=2962043 RepID=UPI0020B86161|nr:ATP-binding protein [Allokutzneria sp. A3M-2-11 16]MCP3798647.1 ATP-binding protein [Allokutzneria sp. A3M-2-11 16]